MSIYQQFCDEQFDGNGMLTGFNLKYEDNFNFGYDVVDQIARQEPDKTALLWCNTDGGERTFTFSDIQKLSNMAANVFLSHGISKGDKVMLIVKRHYEYWYIAVALHKLGAVLVPATHMLTSEDLAYRIKSAEIDAVVCMTEDGVPQNILTAGENAESLRALWTIRESVSGFLNLTEEIEAASDSLVRQETHVSEPFLMYFTSGTTGHPKGVIHDHTYPLTHIITAKYWQQAIDGGLHFTLAETGWAKASWGKLYGQWLAGSAVMVFDFFNFDPKQLMTIINRHHVTTFCAPPTVYRYLLKNNLAEMPYLKHLSTAGEALSTELHRKFAERTGLTLAEGFGQTESALIIGTLAGCEVRPGSIGKPTPLYNVELLKEDSSPAKPGEPGEIVVIPPEIGKQHGIFTAYHDSSELYRYVWRGGIYHTGDIAWRDEDGYYWFIGRIDDMFKSSGYRIGPFEVESVIMELPYVLECGVSPAPDATRGLVVKASIVLKPGTEPTSELKREIQDFVKRKTAPYKYPRKIVFRGSLPKTTSGKIIRKDL